MKTTDTPRRKQTVRLLLAWLLPVAVSLLQWFLRAEIGAYPWFLFFPAVFFAALIGGLWGGIGATLLSALLVGYFFLPPQVSFALDKLSSPIYIAVFIVSGIGLSLFHQRQRDRDEKYRTLFERAGDGIALVDTHGRYVEVNTAYCAMLGRSHAEIVGAPLEEMLVGQTPQVRAAVNDELARAGGTFFERQLRRRDGTILPVEVTVAPLRDGQHLAVVRDISERKRFDAALRRSEEKFAKFFRSSPIPFSVSRLDNGMLVDVNEAFIKEYGYARADLIGRTTLEVGLYAAVSRLPLRQSLQQEGKVQNAELSITCKSGVVKECLFSAEVLDLPDGPHLLASIIDISARKLAEQQLRDSEERFRLVVENSPNPILLWDETGALRYVSPEAATSLGYSQAKISARTADLHTLAVQPGAGELTAERLADLGATDILTARSWLQALQTIQYCVQHPGEKVQTEERRHMPSGDYHDLRVVSQGFARSSSGCEVVSIIHDITEHRKLERLLHQTNVELEQQVAERTAELQDTVTELHRANAGKDAFLAAVSHELRTPLTGVLNMSELLESETFGSLTPTQHKYVAAITESGQRLVATVNGILLYTNLVTRATPLEIETCRLAELCAIAVRSLNRNADAKHQRITQEISPFDLQIESDANGIVKVLKELLENAVKFTPNGGSIDLTVTGETVTGGTGAAKPATDAVRIVVADTGIGISVEQLSALFRPFSQGDQTLARRFEGLGLGLAYVHEMVVRLGGTVTVESEPGRGSRFIVTLPTRASQ